MTSTANGFLLTAVLASSLASGSSLGVEETRQQAYQQPVAST